MSIKFDGRQFNLGIGKETTRGTAVAASYWLPFNTITIDDEITVAKDQTSIGVIEEGVGQEITTFEAKGSIDGRITDQGFGLILSSCFGTETKATVVTGVYSHKFTVLQSATHPSLTYSVVEPNSNGGSGYGYALGMIEELQMMFETDKYAAYKLSFMCNKGATNATTTSYTAENAFRPQDGTISYATTYSGLSSPTSLVVKKLDLTIKKNIVPDKNIGSQSPTDRLNRQFSVSGSFEMFYKDRTLIDTFLLGDAYMALQFVFANTAVTIGSASNPTITIKLARCKLESVARKVDVKDIVSETVKFNAFYSISDSEMLDITLQNTVATTY